MFSCNIGYLILIIEENKCVNDNKNKAEIEYDFLFDKPKRQFFKHTNFGITLL